LNIKPENISDTAFLAFGDGLSMRSFGRKCGASRLPSEGAERKIAVVLVAAGRGERAGSVSEGPKQYRLIGGRSIIAHTIDALLRHSSIGPIAVVIHPDDEDLFHQSVAAHHQILVVHGGATRQVSTYMGLLALRALSPDFVMIHDAVRPFVDHALLNRIMISLEKGGGVIPAVAISDTIKQVDSALLILATVPRTHLYGAQTPQAFSYDDILAAHERASAAGSLEFTDDASIAEYAGIPVRIVEGSAENVKLTWKRDIEMADQTLSARFPDVRVGNGYDVHAFEKGTHVTLCGVGIPHTAKLSGHSDADVALHALTDALLATRGAGDIGTHFPPSDKKWKGAASRIFVEHAVRLVKDAGGRIANADVTLICEAPKIGPHREAMIMALSGMLGVDPERISVKATTNEKLGFIGRGEGIAAIATVSVVYPGTLT
jgi:2-C-methyl-D-erythritol 4-phosphate cytidylyltransferase / 2-C-methyl-D-erythritol 2,4-cyclodiphosphate synthase